MSEIVNAINVQGFDTALYTKDRDSIVSEFVAVEESEDLVMHVEIQAENHLRERFYNYQIKAIDKTNRDILYKYDSDDTLAADIKACISNSINIAADKAEKKYQANHTEGVYDLILDSKKETVFAGSSFSGTLVEARQELEKRLRAVLGMEHFNCNHVFISNAESGELSDSCTTGINGFIQWDKTVLDRIKSPHDDVENAYREERWDKIKDEDKGTVTTGITRSMTSK